jgi:hypothetical protein
LRSCGSESDSSILRAVPDTSAASSVLSRCEVDRFPRRNTCPSTSSPTVSCCRRARRTCLTADRARFRAGRRSTSLPRLLLTRTHIET